MLDTLQRLLPIIIGIAAGYSLRRLGMVDHRDGEAVFKLVFYVFLPAAMFVSLSTVQLGRQFAIYPLAAVAIIVAGYLAGRLMAAKARFNPVQVAVAVTACMIVNSGFALPFVQALYGQEGVARIAAFDAVNTTVTMTWGYYLAARGNPRHQGESLLLGRLAKSPALYATASGLLINLSGVQVPAAIGEPVAKFGSAIAVLISLGVGILFDPLGGSLRRAGLIVAVRLGTGLAVATAIVLILDLDGMDRTIVLLLGAAPVAFSVVTFASLEDLDIRLATTALSLSLMTGLALSLLVTFISG
jgi:predicted permease